MLPAFHPDYKAENYVTPVPHIPAHRHGEEEEEDNSLILTTTELLANMIRERTLETEDMRTTVTTVVAPGVEEDVTTPLTMVEMDEFLNVEEVEDTTLTNLEDVVETTNIIIGTEEEQTTDIVDIGLDEEQTTIISSIMSSNNNPLSQAEGNP